MSVRWSPPFPTSNCIIKRLLGKMASLIGRIEDLVVEDREVECQAKTNGVGWSKVSGGDLGGCLVCFQRLVGRILTLIADGELGEVAVIVALPVTGISRLRSNVHTCGIRTSCGRRPSILLSSQTGSNACREHQGYHGRCPQARPRSFDGIL